MQKLILSGLMAAGVLAGSASMAHADHHASMSMMMDAPDVAGVCMERTGWSEAECGCVADKAADTLTAGQTALLLSIGDGEVNWFSTAKEHDVSLLERFEVRMFARWTVPACVLSN